MLIVMQKNATVSQISAVITAIEKLGLRPEKLPGAERTAKRIMGN